MEVGTSGPPQCQGPAFLLVSPPPPTDQWWGGRPGGGSEARETPGPSDGARVSLQVDRKATVLGNREI